MREPWRALVMCLAVDRAQAKIVKDYVRGYFEYAPLLGDLITKDMADGFELSNGAEVAVHTNSFRAVRGRSIALAIFDECAFWRDADSATPDVETYNAVLPGRGVVWPVVCLCGAILVCQKS